MIERDVIQKWVDKLNETLHGMATASIIEEDMKFPILYKYTTKGQPQQWQIFVKGDQFWTEEGIVDGKLTTSIPTVCVGKNVGRSNETTPSQQAIAEAKAKHQKKIDKGYNEKISMEKAFFEPMLAHEESKYKKLLFTVPTYIQPKLDGLRAVSQDNTLMSRNGKPYVACPHLYQDRFIVDGELYSHQYHDDFNKIVSLCKRGTPSPEELAESEDKVKFYAYDFPSQQGVFSDRYEALKRFLKILGNSSYVLVPTHQVFNQDEVDGYHAQFLADGYEGSILRLDLGDYENKRSKQLLKKKDFMDDEFRIIDAEEGEGGRTGTIGKFHIELPNGNTCKTNIKGDFDFLKAVWKDRKKYIGTKATIKFFGYTPDGALRFPYAIKLNRAEYE